MSELPYAAFDADNHYYEALDAFTRHVDPKMQPRCVQWCEINGRKYHRNFPKRMNYAWKARGIQCWKTSSAEKTASSFR